MLRRKKVGPSIDECRERLKRARSIIGCLEALQAMGTETLAYLEVGCCFREDEGLSTYVAAKFIAERLGRGRVLSIEADPDHVRASTDMIANYQPDLLDRIEWIPGTSLEVLPHALDGLEAVNFAFLPWGAVGDWSERLPASTAAGRG